MSENIALELGLEAEEYQHIKEKLRREPNFTELGIFSAMWSEHCSYKSSRAFLSRLPTEGDCVICGPGENAGVVDIGDNKAAVFKMESHNHPSYIEPYHGAATGVGGVMRDIFTMGARPVANFNALRFGDPEHPKTKHLLSGVVSGLADYGNCVGVPMLGGATGFDTQYDDNILVNAMCVGIARQDAIFYARAGKPGNQVFYVGSKTGRDGIHGATMASASFEDDTDNRPTVQVGDPFAEKLLLEACLELMQTGAIVGIQDMGAAGLTSSAVEIAAKGGVGIRLNLDNVPLREPEMSAYEIMLSESQERMLVILKPGKEKLALQIFEKWQLDCINIGEITDTEQLEVMQHNERQACLPLDMLAQPPLAPSATEAPPDPAAVPSAPRTTAPVPVQADARECLLKLLNSPELGSRRWIYQQYDQTVMGDSIRTPGADAAIVRIHGSTRALAVSVDVTPRYVHADPLEGGRQAVAESFRNLVASGAKPLAITNCLNFGNPKKPETTGQFANAIEGMREACIALDFPVVSGNVSFYNETRGHGIPPTPSIGGVGLIDDITRIPGTGFNEAGDAILLLGETHGHLECSLYARVNGVPDGAPPPVDLGAEKHNGAFVLEHIRNGGIRAAHDISAGGLIAALAQMSLLGGRGAVITPPASHIHPNGILFGEDQARYIVTCSPEDTDKLLEAAKAGNVPAIWIGTAGDANLTIEGVTSIALKDLREAFESWMPNYMRSN